MIEDNAIPEAEAVGKICVSIQIGNCIGSRCMGWRWVDPEYERTRLVDAGGEPDGAGWEVRNPPGIGPCWQRKTIVRRGYCGLAGSP